MLNKLWGFMIVGGIIYAAFAGKLGDVGSGTLTSAKEAVSLAITMLGIMSFWTGLMNVAKEAGILRGMNRLLRPILYFLFPSIDSNSKAYEWIGANMVANILGLGWAATPFGLKAMQELKVLNKESTVASADMCTFLVINISTLQLVPVNIIAYRSQYGSVSPTAIMAAGLIATICSTCAGILFATIARKITQGKKC